MMRRIHLWLVLTLVAGLATSQTTAPLDPYQEAERQRELFRQTSGGILPGELFSAQGEQLFFTKRGPQKVSLEGCDFGLGAGRLEGAYSQLPRYFADTNRVEDLETRIVSCMVRLQGFQDQQVKRDEVRALTAFIASKSGELPLQVNPQQPREVEMYQLGQALWSLRAGVRDFSCAVCHDQYAGGRVRLAPVRSPAQGLGNLWPAYRFEVDKLYTLQDRIAYCYETIAIRSPALYSPPMIALSMYILTEATRSGQRFTELPGFTR
jgi:sulfur-oxidizing protein SoxA